MPSVPCTNRAHSNTCEKIDKTHKGFRQFKKFKNQQSVVKKQFNDKRRQWIRFNETTQCEL